MATLNLLTNLLLLALAVLALFKPAVLAYLIERARRLAHLQSAAALTDTTEGAKFPWDRMREAARFSSEFRLAAIERRLQAHQEAFTMWRNLFKSDNTAKAVVECQDWYDENCLYLEPKVRQAFLEAYVNDNMRHQFIQAHANADLIQQCWEKVIAFPPILFEAVKLGPLNDEERKAVEPEKEAPPSSSGA